MTLQEILESVKSGSVSVEEAERILKKESYEEMGYAKLDTSRKARTGFAEVIYCSNKADEHLLNIFERLYREDGEVFGTRASQHQYELVKEKFPETEYDPISRILKVEKKDKKPDIDDSIPSALMVDEPKTIETVPAVVVEEKPKNTPAPSKNQEKSSPQNNKKDNAQPKNKSADMPAAQAMPIKESHTPVLDVLNQKGFDVIPSAIIKNTTIDYIGVSKNQLFLCLIDKEAGDWLADEEKFNDEEPLWFSESSHRISPVRKIDVARDILKTKLAVGDMNFEIIAYVIIQAGNIINAEDMFEIWNNMNVNVTRINRGSPKEIRLFSKSLDNCEEKTDKNTLEKLKKLIRSLA